MWTSWLRYCYAGYSVWLVLLLGMPFPGQASDTQGSTIALEDHDLIRLPQKHWLGLAVSVEEYHPIVEYSDSRNEIRSLAVMPGLKVQLPAEDFQPYVGLGLGLSINGLPLDTSINPLSRPVEDSFIVHIGGGFTYHLNPSVTFLGSVRYEQFLTTEFLGDLSPTLSPYLRDGLDYSAYTLEFGFRLNY